MLESLFSRSLSRYTSSAHAADLEGFASAVHATGVDNRRAERHTRRLQRVLESAALPSNAAIGTDALLAAFSRWPRKGYVGTYRLFCRFLREHGRLAVPEDDQPRYALMRQYLQRQVELRGIAQTTFKYDRWALTDFLSRTLKPDESPSSLTTGIIDGFFRQRRPQLARRTFHHTVNVTRNFLRYAYQVKVLPEPLHEFELPRGFRFEQPPRALPTDQVEALLATIDRSTLVGARDHAMLYLMASYGLRPHEVATLTRSSIDWNELTLQVEQSKTHSRLLLPLSTQTLAVLRTYINFFDQCSSAPKSPLLFGLCQAPFGPLSTSAISTRFKVYARRTGLPIAGASTYSLRHSFAMRLLGAGVGMQLIGDLMGHRCLASTSAYLRIQIDMLREVALDVPSEVTP